MAVCGSFSAICLLRSSTCSLRSSLHSLFKRAAQFDHQSVNSENTDVQHTGLQQTIMNFDIKQSPTSLD